MLTQYKLPILACHRCGTGNLVALRLRSIKTLRAGLVAHHPQYLVTIHFSFDKYVGITQYRCDPLIFNLSISV